MADGHARENFLSPERKFSLLSSVAAVRDEGHARENFLSPERKFSFPSAVCVRVGNASVRLSVQYGKLRGRGLCACKHFNNHNLVCIEVALRQKHWENIA